MKIVNTYHVGYPDLDSTGASFLTVLVRDENINTLSVYSALVKLPSPESEDYKATREAAAQLVMCRGSKETYRRAVTFYPGLKEKDYRI